MPTTYRKQGCQPFTESRDVMCGKHAGFKAFVEVVMSGIICIR